MGDTILLVDDEAGICKVLSLSLLDSGYEVFTAENGDKALRIFEKNHPPIVITDIKMPGMDGIELLRHIKQRNPDTEVIMITGHGDIDLAIKSLKHEATDFITKPINEDALEVALKRARERISMRRQLRQYTENLENLVREKSEKLIAAERLAAVGETVAGLSHTIKSIAGGLRGGSFVLEKGIELADRTYLDQGWEIVRGNVEKITRLSLDLLDYAKISEIKYVRCDPNRPAREVYDLLRTGARDRGITFTAALSPDLAPIWFNPEEIHRCLLNLVANAIDACSDQDRADPDRRVWLRSSPADDRGVVYEVQDTGVGMNRQTRENLFKAFFTTKGSKGTGIGLMMAKKIIDLHQGELKLETTAGTGTTFSVRLPAGSPPLAG